MLVRLALAWTDPSGVPHGPGEMVDIDAVTLAVLEEQGVVHDMTEDPKNPYTGPTGPAGGEEGDGYTGPTDDGDRGESHLSYLRSPLACAQASSTRPYGL